MLHYAEIKPGRFETKPVSVTCACGTAGDFATVDEARAWIEGHFRNVGGVDTTELHVADDELKQAEKQREADQKQKEAAEKKQQEAVEKQKAEQQKQKEAEPTPAPPPKPPLPPPPPPPPTLAPGRPTPEEVVSRVHNPVQKKNNEEEGE
jgi:sRNA-binding protein